jgi:uncharacterized protein YcfL
MSRKIAMLALSAATLALASCATPPEGGVIIDQQNNVRPQLNTVRVIDSTLARYTASAKVQSVLDVEGKFVSRTATGFPKVTIQLRNKINQAIPLEVRASWYDDQGVPTDSSPAWTRLFVQPQAMVTFENVSIKTQSAQYYVEVRATQ